MRGRCRDVYNAQCVCYRVARYPSKSSALVVAGGADDVIFRSDSNAEDLEG
jgi:hypothetical protein